MEIIPKSHHSAATMPLLPIISNNNPSNPKQSITSQFIAKLVTVYRTLLLALGTFTLLCVLMSTPIIVSETPKFRLHSLFVSKLNVSNTSLGTNWDVAFTIENPSLVSWLRFDRIEGSILYKDNPLTTHSSVEPIDLGLKEERMVRVQISSTGLREDHQPVVKEGILEEMINRQREDGAVSLSMEMFAWGRYRTGWWKTQDVVMKPRCLDLRVGFLPKVGFGSWISGGPLTCSID